MKHLPLIIGISLGAIGVVVGGVFVYESMIRAPRAYEEQSVLKNYNFPGKNATKNTPKEGFGSTSLQSATETGEINSYLSELEATVDDGGSQEFDTFKEETSGL